MKTLNIAILGAGGMGRLHGENLLKIPGVAVCAVCDESEERASTLSRNLRATAYTNFSDMLQKESPDALYICLPPFAHSGQFELAASRGIHIFIEKPIALDTSRARSMVSSAQASGVLTQVGFHMRFGSAVKRLKEMIDSGKAGKAVMFNGRYQCNSLHTPWWIDKSRSGGQIFEQAIHVYDMCRYLLGEPIFTCGIMENILHKNVPGYTVEDISASVSGFSNGAIASITASNCSIPGRWDALFEVTFENLFVQFQDPDTAVFLMTNGSAERTELSLNVDHKLEETQSFISLIRDGGSSACDIVEGLHSLLFVETVVKSATSDGQKEFINKL